MPIHPLAGKPAPSSSLVNIPKLITAYYTIIPDPNVPEQCVSFGTSGHRGSSFQGGFNERHILAITQALCEWRKSRGITGPLFLGIDTHALSEPALITALEVLGAHDVEIRLSEKDEYVPTPAVSRAILRYNQGRKENLADGIVITPSHNPPDTGGFKYNAVHGGPADPEITAAIQQRANELLREANSKRIPVEQVLKSSRVQRYPYRKEYVEDLQNVLDMEALRGGKISMGVDPIGGAGVHYWQPIAEKYGLDLTVVNPEVDPTFRFMTLDWDGKIRMDPSSPYAMQRLIALKDRFRVGFACDTDHDRHGIVTKSNGLMPPNHYLCVAARYLFSHRKKWPTTAGIGKTLVSSQMMDRVAQKLGRKLTEVPVGFKWFVSGLADSSFGFVGEESAGASFLRRDGSVWTTDKDGIIAALLAGEITAVTGKDPGELYRELTEEFGESSYDRIDAPANDEQRKRLKEISPEQISLKDLAGEKILSVLTKAPGNGASFGGIKVIAENGWFAARPSGTEDIYKIYAESFSGKDALKRILEEAQTVIDRAINS